MRLIFITREDVQDGNIVITKEQIIHHIKNVMRLKIGDVLDLSDNENYVYVGEIKSIESRKIVFNIKSQNPFKRENKIRITLCQSMPKQKKIETIVQKSVELGVDNIIPFISQRTQLNKGFDVQKKTEKLVKVIEEAGTQSGEVKLPNVSQILSSQEMIDWVKEKEMPKILLHEKASAKIREVLCDYKGKGISEICIIVGPEGGFSQQEVSELSDAGAIPTLLPTNILRTETAALVAISMVKYEFE